MLKFMEGQLHWPNWWHIMPSISTWPDEIVICWSIIQTRWHRS